MIVVFCAFLSGAMFYASMGVNDVWWLAVFAPMPLLWLGYGDRPSWQVFAASVIAYAAGQISTLETYGATIAMMIAVSAIIGGLIHAAAILFARQAQRRLPALAAVFAYPALWTAVEYLNANVSANGSFGAFAYALVPAPVLIQSASLFGLWSVSFLLCATASAAALVVRLGRAAMVAGIVVAVLFAANLAFGMARLAAPAAPAIRVAALGNGETRLLSNETAARDISQRYAKAAAALAAAGARTVVLPEEIAVLKPQWRDAADVFARAAQSTGSRFVVGYRTLGPVPRNAALTFSRDGTAQYEKRHLIPGLEPVVPGHGAGLLGDGRAVAICKDMDFGKTIRDDARHGISILFVPAWDFGRDGEAHANMAIMRGVENGFAMVRAARNGLLTITDAEGRVLARAAASGNMTAIIAAVSPGPGPTLYTRMGDLFAWACAMAVIAMAASMVPWRRLTAVRR